MRSLRRFSFLLAVLIGWSVWASAEDRIPSRAYAYRRTLHAEVERTWGLHIPPDAIAISAGTIHQESAWNPMAHSAFAKGLTQFTDPTWADMVAKDHTIAAIGDIWNPHAAMRAMVTYHHALWSNFPVPEARDNRWAFILSAYNGGPGYVIKDQKLCATILECLPTLWWGNVELHSTRAPWAFKENRGYPRNILKRWLPLYRTF